MLELTPELLHRLREYEASTGMTRAKLAKRLGVSQASLSRWFSGATKTIKSVTVRERLSELLKFAPSFRAGSVIYCINEDRDACRYIGAQVAKTAERIVIATDRPALEGEDVVIEDADGNTHVGKLRFVAAILE